MTFFNNLARHYEEPQILLKKIQNLEANHPCNLKNHDDEAGIL